VLSAFQLETIAARMRTAQDEARHIGPFTSRVRDFDLPSAYAAADLIDALSKQPDYVPLQAANIVTAATITTALPVRAGKTWQRRLQGIALPRLAVKFVQ
jgi:2-keto-4-pentenoate hydratase